MKFHGDGVHAATFPMSPDSRINWQRHEIASYAGTLYTSPDCPPDAAEMVLRCSEPSVIVDQTTNKFLGAGCFGKVFEFDQYALKIDRALADNSASERHVSRDQHIRNLRANVCLQAGLTAVGPIVRPPNYGGEPLYMRTVRYEAPQTYCAFIPDVDSGLRGVWCMDSIPTDPVQQIILAGPSMPTQDERSAVYLDALSQYGIEERSVFLDDVDYGTRPRNTLIRPTPEHPNDTSSPLTIVKIDILGEQMFDRQFD